MWCWARAKVGNFVVSTPTLQGLRARFPDAVIGFIGSEVTAEFEEAHPCIDWRTSWDHSCKQPLKLLWEFLAEQLSLHGSVALAINLDGFNPVTQVLVSFLAPDRVAGIAFDHSRRRLLPLGELPQQSFLRDLEWDSVGFVDRHQGVFKSNYIAELFAVMAGVADYCDPTNISLPSLPPPFYGTRCTNSLHFYSWCKDLAISPLEKSIGCPFSAWIERWIGWKCTSASAGFLQ